MSFSTQLTSHNHIQVGHTTCSSFYFLMWMQLKSDKMCEFFLCCKNFTRKNRNYLVREIQTIFLQTCTIANIIPWNVSKYSFSMCKCLKCEWNPRKRDSTFKCDYLSEEEYVKHFKHILTRYEQNSARELTYTAKQHKECVKRIILVQ